MKKNGFIMSSYVYMLLVFFLLVILSMLTVFNNSRLLSNKLKSNNTKLTVNLNGGISSQTFEEEYESLSILTLIDPTRSEYIFTGWTVTGEGASINGTELTIGTGDTTITANWEINNPVYSYSCANASAGSSPYALTYTGNCTVIDDGNGNWRVKFLTSGTFISISSITIDAFLVGGGGGGGKHAAGGGGGGYTITESVVVSAGTPCEITIGTGGSGGSSTNGSGGGNTVAFGITASGGSGGINYDSGANGGAGGSGGGGGAGSGSGSNGGTDGSSGNDSKGGIGQGTTTYEFGDATATLYSGGGGGGGITAGGIGGDGGGANGGKDNTVGSNAVSNTGGGGGGGGRYANGGNGGSGIVIIRNAR